MNAVFGVGEAHGAAVGLSDVNTARLLQPRTRPSSDDPSAFFG